MERLVNLYKKGILRHDVLNAEVRRLSLKRYPVIKKGKDWTVTYIHSYSMFTLRFDTEELAVKDAMEYLMRVYNAV